MQTSPLAPVRAARIAPNTLNTRRIPIVFVPGIMGSRLHFTDIDQYWDPDSNYNMSHWLRITAEREMNEIDFQSPVEVMTDTSAVKLTDAEKGRVREGVSWSSYGPFLRFLDGQSFSPATCRLYCVGYDWRQSNRDSGKYLIGKIDDCMQKENAKKVIILTHSMGGLVTRSALKESSALASKVLGVVHVVHPAHGAVCLYRRFFTGVRSAEDGGWGFAKVLGNTSSKFTAVASGLPGAIELLPNNLYRDDGGANWLAYIDSGSKHFWTGNVYDSYRSFQAPPGLPDSSSASGVPLRIHRRIAGAESFHNGWLGDYMLTGKTYSIYGTGIATDTSIVFDPPSQPAPVRFSGRAGVQGIRAVDWPDYGAKMQRPPNGDGTVPQSSGDALFPNEISATIFDPKSKRHQYYVSPLGHEPAYQSSDTQLIVMGILKKILGI